MNDDKLLEFYSNSTFSQMEIRIFSAINEKNPTKNTSGIDCLKTFTKCKILLNLLQFIRV